MNVIADSFNLSFSGRSPRRNYWVAILFYAVAGYLLQTLDYALWDITITEMAWNATQYIIAACYLVIFVLAWAMTVRRFHDIGRTGWWSLVCMLPLLGNILSLVIGLLASAEGANRYGPNPYGEEARVISAQDTIRALDDLDRLREKGVITPDEFEAQKNKILNK